MVYGNMTNKYSASNFRFEGTLKKGDNIVACRILSGSGGFPACRPASTRRISGPPVAFLEPFIPTAPLSASVCDSQSISISQFGSGESCYGGGQSHSDSGK